MQIVWRIAAVTIVLASCAVMAQEADKRVEPVLKQTGIDYKIDSDGDYKIEYSVGGNRTQLVFITSVTEKMGNLEIREVWSPAKRGGELTAAQANKLLLENARYKLGAWECRGADERRMVVFCARIPTNADADALKTLITTVAELADAAELELVGNDDL